LNSKKIRLILPSFYALIISVALIAFSAWYILFFNAGKLYHTSRGIPVNYGLKEFDPLADSGNIDLGYEFQLKESDTTFVLRMYGENFNVTELEKKLSGGNAVEVVFHPMKNEHGEFEVYQIAEGGNMIYTFNKKFSAISSKTFGWILLLAGAVLFLFGVFSLRRRLRLSEEDDELSKEDDQ
jgi:hypothetical protein